MWSIQVVVAVVNGKSYQRPCRLGHGDSPSDSQSPETGRFDRSNPNSSSIAGYKFVRNRSRCICVGSRSNFQTLDQNTDPNYNRVCYNLSIHHNYTQTYFFLGHNNFFFTYSRGNSWVGLSLAAFRYP